VRILGLCVATFLAGLMAGSLFVWSGPSGSRAGADRAPPPKYDWGRDGTSDWSGGADAGRFDADAGDAPARNADVRSLTREAAAEIARIKDRADAAAVLAGEGTISGTVRDPAGEPVAGVIVTVIPRAEPFGVSVERRRARERSHEDRDLADVAGEAVQLELWRRDVRRTARTGPDGRYELKGLMDSDHGLSAYHEDYDVQPLSQRGRVQPDAVVDLLARPVADVEVTVRTPEGSTADNAYVRWTQAGNARGQIPWTSDRPTVRLPLGTCKVKAQKWTPEALESDEVETEIRADARNELVLELKGRLVLAARLTLPEGFVLPRSVEYRIRPVARGSDDVDPATLLKDSQRPGYARTPGRAYWFDLEPGRYVVAAFLDRRRLIAHAVADVGDGTTEVDLEVSEPDTSRAVVVRLLGPDGGPVPGNAWFRVMGGTGKRPLNHRADALQRADGAWVVYLDGIPESDGDATLRAGTSYGRATRALNLRGGGTITIRLGEPAVVSLAVDRYGGSGVEGALYAGLRSPAGADAWGQVGADGTCDLRGVQPGDYDLLLVVRRNNRNWVISKEPVRLRSGDHERTVTVPTLHTVRVRWAGKGRPRNVVLRCTDPVLGGFRRDARLQDGVATFEALAAGSYRVECARKRKDIRVPTTEVVLE